ncbi:hypothetical protein [Paenibacillus cymbidii]|uniref:hypothetical protein n=1 Tax=Paenibacillus cymbidii TaxID=1639034 RepID=UPI001436B113|nr:hypothetical protein [Paenibacillus cymbidii]
MPIIELHPNLQQVVHKLQRVENAGTECLSREESAALADTFDRSAPGRQKLLETQAEWG